MTIHSDYGIDTIRISVPITMELCDGASDLFTNVTTNVSGVTIYTGTKYIGEAKVWVRIDSVRLRALIEFNAPKAAGLAQPMLLPPGALIPLVEKVLLALPEIWTSYWHVDKEDVITVNKKWPDLVRINRLDIAQNFHIPPQWEAFMRRGVSQVIGSQGLRSTIQGKGRGWTASQITKSQGRDRLYDKSVEANLEPGINRFETQLQNERLRSSGMTNLAQVTDERCWATLENRWHATRWGQPLTMPTPAAELLASLPRNERHSMAAYLATAAYGDSTLFTHRQLRKYRRIARSLGLNSKQPLDQLGDRQLHLDLATGTVQFTHMSDQAEALGA